MSKSGQFFLPLNLGLLLFGLLLFFSTAKAQTTTPAAESPPVQTSAPIAPADRANVTEVLETMRLLGGTRMIDMIIERTIPLALKNEAHKRGLSPEMSEILKAELTAELRASKETLLRSMAEVWADLFTAKEIKALKEIYQSPVMIKMQQIQPQIMERAAPMAHKWIGDALVRVHKRISARLEEGKKGLEKAPAPPE